MPTDISLAPAAAALGRLSHMIEFGRSAAHPGLADAVDRAGYAVAGLRDVLVPMLREVARDNARSDTPTLMPAGEES